MSAYRRLKEYEGREIEFLLQPAECIFQEGACHAFACELQDYFTKIRVESDVLIFGSHGQLIATHAWVRAFGKFWDVTGPAAPYTFRNRWEQKEGVTLQEHVVGCITSLVTCDTNPDSGLSPFQSRYGGYCETEFMRKARRVARRFINDEYVPKFLKVRSSS